VGAIGDPVTYCFTVTNTGDTYLKGVTVTDTDLFGGYDIGVMADGEVVQFCHETTILGNLLNTARVVGTPCEDDGTTDLGLPNVNHHDHAAVAVCAPCESQETCETAYARSRDESQRHCFLDIAELGSNNWGWSNGPLGTGEYTFDLYAGAGQCDISNGILVGTLSVNYDGAAATVTYNITEPGCGMDETHLYVGSEILPRNGESFTTAPGLYPGDGLPHDDLGGATTDTYTITGLSDDIYVVAHAVVCCGVTQPESVNLWWWLLGF